MRINPLALSCLLLGGCALGPNFEKPSPWSPASWFRSEPPSKLASLPVAEPVDPTWWRVFNDPVLTGLMRRVAASNLDVRASTFRLAQSRAQRGVTAAGLYPTLNGNASYTRERISPNGVAALFGGGGGSAATGNNGSGTGTQTSSNGLGGRQGGIPSSIGGQSIPPFDLFQGGFDASWELDLWGRVRRQVEAADATIDASVEARRQLLIASLSELARDYIQLRGTQEMLSIARANLKSAQESAGLTRERASGGLATDLDVAQALAQVENTAATIPQYEQQIAQGINAISLLLGAPPGALNAELSPKKPVPPAPPKVPIGLPSELVKRRPDIRQSEAQLHAAVADIGAAEAAFFPTITLSGSAALQATQFKNWGNISSATYGLGPSLTLPIFEGGRLRRTLELRKAAEKEAAVNYQRTVLGAFHDVDNALIAYRAEQTRRERLAAQVTQARRQLDLARQQYRSGLSNFLDVLTAQRTVFSAEEQLANSTALVGTNLVALYNALGGGWETSFQQASR